MSWMDLRQCCLLIICLFGCACGLDFYEEDFLNDPQTFPTDAILATPEIHRLVEGSTVLLKCQPSECDENGHKNNFKWEFKHCRPNSCGKYYESAFAVNSAFSNKWRKVASKSARSTNCQHEQRISQLKGEHSGLYRCVVNNRTVQIYQVEVVEAEKSMDPSPKILEMIPGNITLAVNTQLILQCRIYSPLTPLIVWFKQCDGSKDVSRDFISYNGHYYSRINAAGDTSFVQKEENVYLSKLNIYKVSLRDSGVYACACVNDNSYNVQTVVVRVQGFENWEGHTSFSLLFLIPLVFALVPITVWLCYYKNKRKVLDQTLLQRKKLIQHTHVPVV